MTYDSATFHTRSLIFCARSVRYPHNNCHDNSGDSYDDGRNPEPYPYTLSNFFVFS